MIQFYHSALAACTMLAAAVSLSAVEPVILDRAAVVRLAHEQAPELLAEQERLGIALGELRQARLWPYNPELSLSGGPRMDDGETTWDRSVGISQRLPLSGRRDAAAGVAAARVEETRAAIAERRRAVALEAVRRYLGAVHADARVALARRAVDLAEHVVAVTGQQHAAGEANELDANVAAIALARAQAGLREAEAEVTADRARLTALLGLEPETPITIAGALDWPVPTTAALADILRRRPELTRILAEGRAAEAAGALVDARTGIDPTLSLGYGREEGADIVRLGLSIELPVADRGQGDRAAAAAAVQLARRQRMAAQLRITAEVTAATEEAAALQTATADFRQAVLPRLEANERLTDAAFRTGSLSFSEVLSQQREVLSAREELLALEHRAAVAAAEATAAAALPPFIDPPPTQDPASTTASGKDTP